MAIYPFLQRNFVDKSMNDRQQIIETIRKLRKGESFIAFKERFSMDKNITLSDEELEKLYISYNFMDSVIKKIVSYCPNLDKVKTRSNRKRKLIKEWLNEIDWKAIESEVYETLEEDGDCYLEIYFNNENDTLPRFRVLDSANMLRGLLDDKNRYKQYVYREFVEDEITDYYSGNIVINKARERVIIFEKGRKLVFDPLYDEKGLKKIDKSGNIEYGLNIIENRDSYKEYIPLIHFRGIKKQSQEFSEIPSEKYIDNCLHLDQITSDLRQINRMLGYPFIMIVDGEPVQGHTRSPASIMGVKTDPSIAGEKQAQIIDIQIKNRLDSVFEEFKITRDDLYDKCGLITPTLREKLNVDSSRVVQQLNLPSENKIEIYVDSIIKAMELPFMILLKENNLYNENTDKGISFLKPDFMIKSSPFDELLFEQSEVKSKKKSQKETYIENMDTDEEIKLREIEIEEENVEDVDTDLADEVVNRVSEGQKVDKRLISE